MCPVLKMVKKGLAKLLAAVMMTAAVTFPGYGAAAISNVTLEVENDIKAGDDYSVDAIEITGGKGHYSVGEIEILNEDGWWKEDDIPKITVRLYADDGYYFTIARSDIRIKGGTYVSARKEDSYTLLITLTLPSLLENLEEITKTQWNSVSQAEWSRISNAGYYEVRLYRDGKAVGNTQKVTEPEIDFGNLMRQEGSYQFRVRAVNRKNNEIKSQWIESGTTSYVDGATAESMRIQYGTVIPDYITEPSQMNQIYYAPDQYGWIHDNGGWWYRNPDKSYTTSNWQLIDGKWYYFNSVGYMVTGWIDWEGKSYYCDPENGDMQVNKVIPDGTGRRVDSTGAWIQ